MKILSNVSMRAILDDGNDATITNDNPAWR